MKEIEAFRDALARGPEFLKETSPPAKAIGYLCAFVPEELILAAGFHPMRLFSSQPEIRLADQHLQSYCCSPVKGILEDSLSGSYDFLYGAVFPQTCDTITRLSDIWRLKHKHAFFADLSWPSKLNTPTSLDYVKQVLTQFRSQLEEAAGQQIEEDALMDAVATCNRIRTHIRRLYQIKSDQPDALAAADLYTIVKGAMILDRHQAADLLQQIVHTLESHNTSLSGGKRLILSGAACEIPDLVNTVESAGGFIVGDDFCTGLRWFNRPVETAQNLMDGLAQRIVGTINCPAKHTGLTTRADHLISLAKSLQADGVLFLLNKFCDPHAFDFPTIKTALDEKQIKNSFIELDGADLGTGQISTRIESFIEML